VTNGTHPHIHLLTTLGHMLRTAVLTLKGEPLDTRETASKTGEIPLGPMNAFFSSLVFDTVATALHQPGSVVVGPLRPASCVLVTLSAARRVQGARAATTSGGGGQVRER